MDSVFKFSRDLKIEKDIMGLVNCVFELGKRYELESVDLCKSATAISELATNLVKYAKNGSMTVHLSKSDSDFLLSIESKDDGPGIEDIELAMSENFSSGKSLGVGLPAVKRLTDTFEIESSSEGTLIKVSKRIGRLNA
ncbi:MAG: hypothetical protein CME64_12235 [Halobacteriovoraceae bacterium]|nr:hypothetical protein [Halobacteriovoraceae bacterium]|tara:strand:- start:250672 stop:251088 length:417 start_codon:yes stop_codon:yes gene_type:complete